MHQKTLAELEYDWKQRKTRREKFLERVEKLFPRCIGATRATSGTST